MEYIINAKCERCAKMVAHSGKHTDPAGNTTVTSVLTHKNVMRYDNPSGNYLCPDCKQAIDAFRADVRMAEKMFFEERARIGVVNSIDGGI